MKTNPYERLSEGLASNSKKKLTVTLDGEALAVVVKHMGTRSAKETVSDLVFLGADKFEELSKRNQQ